MRLAPFFQYIRATQMPTAGAMDMGFESEMLAIRPMIGAAIGQRQQFRTTTNFVTGQSYQATAMNWVAGLSGVNHGQVVLQPLSNPYGGS